MAVADITRIKKRLIAILRAGPRNAAYSATVGTTTGTARYPSDQELTDAILEADARVVAAIIETIGHPYRNQFFTTSGNLSSGELIPAHVGKDAIIKVDGDPVRLASSLNQMLEIIANPTLYTTGKLAYIEDTYIFHNGTLATVAYPNFTMTTVCQSPESYESAVLCGSVGILAKDGASSDYYSYYSNLYVAQETAIRGQELVIPEIEQLAA